jgi:hypothetical protein
MRTAYFGYTLDELIRPTGSRTKTTVSFHIIMVLIRLGHCGYNIAVMLRLCPGIHVVIPSISYHQLQPTSDGASGGTGTCAVVCARMPRVCVRNKLMHSIMILLLDRSSLPVY